MYRLGYSKLSSPLCLAASRILLTVFRALVFRVFAGFIPCVCLFRYWNWIVKILGSIIFSHTARPLRIFLRSTRPKKNTHLGLWVLFAFIALSARRVHQKVSLSWIDHNAPNVRATPSAMDRPQSIYVRYGCTLRGFWSGADLVGGSSPRFSVGLWSVRRSASLHPVGPFVRGPLRFVSRWIGR